MADAVLTSVIANRLRAIGERMGLVVERSARSPLLVEGRDFSLGIYDADGVLLEQTEYIPVLGYATAPGMRAIAQAFAGDVHEGEGAGGGRGADLHVERRGGGHVDLDLELDRPERAVWPAREHPAGRSQL